MAGMLPGVECARRRRLHQSGGGLWDSPSSSSSSSLTHSFTRRSAFCLYTSSHETHHGSGSFPKRGLLNKAYKDEKFVLGGAAREAKERLDERLRAQSKSESKRQKSKERLMDGNGMVPGDLQTEVFGSKKMKSLWSKLTWKACEQEECAICLERYKAGETLVHLPCAHKYHVKCLVPWLVNNAHCPCCRTGIFAID